MDTGRSQPGTTGTIAPERLSGAPRELLARLCLVALANFLVYVRDLLQPTELFHSIRGPQRPSSRRPLERAGVPLAVYGDSVRDGPLFQCARLEKS